MEGDFRIDHLAAGEGGSQELARDLAQRGFVELGFPETGNHPVVFHVMNDAKHGARVLAKKAKNIQRFNDLRAAFLRLSAKKFQIPAMSALYPRHAAGVVSEHFGYFPVVLIEGARQVGKSTMARTLFNDGEARYLTLDDDATRSNCRSGRIRGRLPPRNAHHR